MAKPKILPQKIKLAQQIQANWKSHDYKIGPRGVYWCGTFRSPSGSLSVYVMFQRYVTRIDRVDYVSIHWRGDDVHHNALRVDEIKTLLKSFSEEDFR